MGQWSSIYLLSLPSPGSLEALNFLVACYLAEPLREASRAAPLCAWAYGSQRYKEVPYLPRSGYKIFSKKSAL